MKFLDVGKAEIGKKVFLNANYSKLNGIRSKNIYSLHMKEPNNNKPKFNNEKINISNSASALPSNIENDENNHQSKLANIKIKPKRK